MGTSNFYVKANKEFCFYLKVNLNIKIVVCGCEGTKMEFVVSLSEFFNICESECVSDM